MAEKKRTILMSEDPSKETWQPSAGRRLVRHLREKARIKGFGLKYQPTKTDSFRAGAMKSKGKGASRFIGMTYKKGF